MSRYSDFENRIFDKTRKKRILSLDGGGIRGILTIQILKHLEKILKEKTGNPDTRIRDHFDLIGGTSTGAILAAGLVKGKTASELETLYEDLGKYIFKNRPLISGYIFLPKYGNKALKNELEKEFGDMTLEDTTQNTAGAALGIVAKRLDTSSVWILDNNPRGKYYSHKDYPNKDFLLRDIIRASTAAPHFFAPEKIKLSRKNHTSQEGLFIDGGVSPHNNPAFQLFMLATMKAYEYKWSQGADNLFVLSLGTGSYHNKNTYSRWPIRHAVNSLTSLMDDNAELVELMMQWMGQATTCNDQATTKDPDWENIPPITCYGTVIDSVMGDLRNESLSTNPLFSYARYNPRLESKWLQENFGLKYTEKVIKGMRNMDREKYIPELKEIGIAHAEKFMDIKHIPFF